jgi:hypothetical protein
MEYLNDMLLNKLLQKSDNSRGSKQDGCQPAFVQNKMRDPRRGKTVLGVYNKKIRTDYNFPELKSMSKIRMRTHLYIGGSAMHNLALALHNKGYQVGSDDAIFEPSKSRLDKRGFCPPELGWSRENNGRY